MTKRLEKLYEELAALEAAEREAMRNISAYTDEELDSMVEAINAKEAEIDAEIANPTEDAQEEPKTVEVTMDNLEELTALIFGAEEFQAMKERAARRTEAALEAFKNEIEEIMHEIDENNDIMSREEVEHVKVKTMINRFSAENKQQAQRFIGAIKNNASDKFKSDIVSVNMNELAQAIRQGKTIVPAVIDGKLIDANFKEQQLFMLDIDDAGCSLNEIKRRLREYPYSMIYTSFSHTIAMPKYRIAFIADRVITDAQEARQITVALMDVIGCADSKCADVSRIFFAGKNILETHNRTFSVDKLLKNTSIRYEDVTAPQKKVDRAAIVGEEESGTDNKTITVEQIQENLQELKLELEGTVVDYNGSFEWFNKNVPLTAILGKDLNTRFRCLHSEHLDKKPSATLEEYQGQINYRCCCDNFNSPKSTIDTLHHLLDMDKIEVQYMLADVLGITLGSTYQREMRLLIADTKANMDKLIKKDSVLGKEMKHLWGALSVIQDFASAKVTTSPLSINTNRPSFFMSQSQLRNEMQRLQMKGATAARLKLDQLKDLGFIRPLRDDEIDADALKKAKEVQKQQKIRTNKKELNRVEYYELCAITPTMIKKAEENIKLRKQSGAKKRNMNITRRLNTYGEDFTFNVNVQGKVEQKICFNKNQKEMDKLISAASDLIAAQGYFTEDQLRKQFDPKRKMKKDKVQKLIDDTIPSIISQLNIKKDRVKKATREQFNISAKTKSNTTIYC